jgi:hypothetical protein
VRPECWASLDRPINRAKVPVNSLVRVDTGKRPENLPPLAATKAQLLAPIRASRYLYFMKPKGRQTMPNEAYQRRCSALSQPATKLAASIWSVTQSGFSR